jgi:hypothetical protein
VRTFRQVFPHVIAFRDGGILLGSNEPIPLRRHHWRDRLRDEAIRARLGVQRAKRLLQMMRSARAVPSLAGLPVDDARRLNHDLFPRDEFASPGPEDDWLGLAAPDDE